MSTAAPPEPARAPPPTPGDAPAAPDERSAWRRDRVLLAALAGWLLVAAPYVVYFVNGTLPDDYRNGYAFSILAVLVAFVALSGRRQIRSLVERRFRGLVGISFLIWAGIEIFELEAVAGRAGAMSVIEDSLYIVFYVLFGFAALDDRRVGEATEARRLRALRRGETAVFALGLFVYFVVIPSRLDSHSFASFVPSAFLYVALDGFLLALFARRLMRAERERELRRWRLMTLSAALFLLTDTLYFFDVVGSISLDPYPLIDLLWFVPHLPLVFAVRMPPARDEAVSGDVALAEEELPAAPFAPSFLYAALVPATHLIAESTHVTSAAAADAQRTCALLLTVLLGVIATYHQRRIARAHDALRQEIVVTRRRMGATRKLEAIGHLAAGVAHDFNNLLTVVIGRAELLLGRTEEEKSRRDLETIVRAASRAADLTHELLAVGRRGMGVRERRDSGRMIEASLPELVELCGDRIVLVTELDSRPLPIEIDPAHFERVLRNLVANARDAMPLGGRLTIATSYRAVGAAELAHDEELTPGEYAAVVVADTGSGMDEATLRRLFEPFFTTKGLGRGTGLGLATAYGLVRQNGGRIAVSSRLGEGSRFEVLLPLAVAGTDDARDSAG